MPVAEVEGTTIGQSAALNYYFAAENGLLGTNTLEAAQIMAISEHLKEMNASFDTLVEWGEEPTEEAANKWFDGGATDITGPSNSEGYHTRYLTWWLGRIENALGDKGYAVGDKLSLADVLLYYWFCDYLRDHECPPDFPKFRREPFCDKERTDAALAKHPKIKACCDAVAQLPNIQKWLSMRGVQGF
jgi:glutathione S-transferase